MSSNKALRIWWKCSFSCGNAACHTDHTGLQICNRKFNQVRIILNLWMCLFNRQVRTWNSVGRITMEITKLQVWLLLFDNHHKHVMTLTFSFLHHSTWLGQGKALHRFIFLEHFRTSVYVFQNVVWYFHQHTAIKCMAFLSLGLICPGNSINFRNWKEIFKSWQFSPWLSSNI